MPRYRGGMDGAGDDIIGWTADGLAAGVLGAALGTCLLLFGLPQAAVGAAACGTLVVLVVLRQVKPEPRRFRLPAFAVDVEDSDDDVLELTQLADSDEALLLEDRLQEPAQDSRVVQLFAPRALPTPGELNRRIEAHLASPRASAEIDMLHPDAPAALRQALGDLRRSLA